MFEWDARWGTWKLEEKKGRQNGRDCNHGLAMLNKQETLLYLGAMMFQQWLGMASSRMYRTADLRVDCLGDGGDGTCGQTGKLMFRMTRSAGRI